MKTEHLTGEKPCNINGFRKYEFLIIIGKGIMGYIRYIEE